MRCGSRAARKQAILMRLQRPGERAGHFLRLFYREHRGKAGTSGRIPSITPEAACVFQGMATRATPTDVGPSVSPAGGRPSRR
jgi:hypothetical protein